MVYRGYSTNWRTIPFLEILDKRKLINCPLDSLNFCSPSTSPQPPSHPKLQRTQHHRIITTAKRTPHISLQSNTLFSQGIPIPLSNERIFIRDPVVHLKEEWNFKPPHLWIFTQALTHMGVGQNWWEKQVNFQRESSHHPARYQDRR
jgi:hypothetical protein